MRDWQTERHHGPERGSGGPTAGLWGGGLPRPAGRKPYGRGAARRSAGPHPQAGGSGRNAAPMTAPASSDRAVLLAPGILSPRKDHRQGRALGRVADAMAQAPPLTLIFPGKTSAPIRGRDRARLRPMYARQDRPGWRARSAQGKIAPQSMSSDGVPGARSPGQTLMRCGRAPAPARAITTARTSTPQPGPSRSRSLSFEGSTESCARVLATRRARWQRPGKGHGPRRRHGINRAPAPVPSDCGSFLTRLRADREAVGLGRGEPYPGLGVNFGLTVVGLPGRPGHLATLAGFWPPKAA